MESTFNQIITKISEFSKEDLLDYCYNILDEQNEHKPIWFIFSLMKWTYLYAGHKIPSKILTWEDISEILKLIEQLNDEHILQFFKEKKIDKVFYTLFSQQFYLQKAVNFEKFATQLKLFVTLPGKYNINDSFKSRTGLSIIDFLTILQFTWIFISDKNKDRTKRFNGYLLEDYFTLSLALIGPHKHNKFLELLVVSPQIAKNRIENFNNGVRKEQLQTIEMTFFTMYPFQFHNENFRLSHLSVLNHTVNYFIYDFLKAMDPLFTTEFGYRFEKYIEQGIREIGCKYKNESQIKKMLAPNSKVVDFLLEDCNIFIECKAIELQPFPSANPTDDLLYNSLKDSLFKAYFKQLLNVSSKLSPDKVNWAIIITYKEFFWGDFTELYNLGKEKFKIDTQDASTLLPENVFLMDIYTWDRTVQIVKDKKVTLLDILQKVKQTNSNPLTKKQLFRMHLEEYDSKQLDLSYLYDELKQIRNRFLPQNLFIKNACP